MSSTAQQLERWRRLLSIQTVQRDSLILRQREMENKIASAERQNSQLESAQNDASRTLTATAMITDVALRTAIGLERQTRSAAIKSANLEIKSLKDNCKQIAAEGAKIQQRISVIETRIDECRAQVRREGRRFAA